MMNKIVEEFQFTFEKIEQYFLTALEYDYSVITCAQFHQIKYTHEQKLLINRIDVDFSLKKALKLAEIFNRLNILGTFFIRLHAPEYNPFSFENYRILKFIKDTGHEIGYHSEIIDESAIWNESAEECLQRDIDILNRMLNISVKGVASHGGMTGLNNLDFWKKRKPEEFGLLYEAYDWLNNVFYVSDSEWTQWKCYNKGELVSGDNRTLAEHINDGHPIIYSLIHPDTYYEKHFYE